MDPTHTTQGLVRLARLAPIVAALAMAVASVSRGATYYEGLEIVGWYGEGVNQTSLVFDFSTGDGANDSFAFGVSYGTSTTDTSTIYDLTTAIQADTSSGFHIDATYYEEFQSYLINSISYVTGGGTYTANYRQGDEDPTAYWYVWTSGDVGRNWTRCDIGVGETLAHGEIAGYVAAVPDDYINWTSDTPPVAPRLLSGDANADGHGQRHRLECRAFALQPRLHRRRLGLWRL